MAHPQVQQAAVGEGGGEQRVGAARPWGVAEASCHEPPHHGHPPQPKHRHVHPHLPRQQPLRSGLQAWPDTSCLSGSLCLIHAFKLYVYIAFLGYWSGIACCALWKPFHEKFDISHVCTCSLWDSLRWCPSQTAQNVSWMDSAIVILTSAGSRFFGKVQSTTGQSITVGVTPPRIIACLQQTAQMLATDLAKTMRLLLDQADETSPGSDATCDQRRQPLAVHAAHGRVEYVTQEGASRGAMRGDGERQCLATETPVICDLRMGSQTVCGVLVCALGGEWKSGGWGEGEGGGARWRQGCGRGRGWQPMPWPRAAGTSGGCWPCGAERNTRP